MNKVGEKELISSFSGFSCDVNKDIQDFLQLKSIDFAKKRMSITYLVVDNETGDLLGFFTLAHKVLYVPAEGLSNTVKRRLERYGSIDKNTNSYLLSAFLLAQFGKNYAIEEDKRITGIGLMDCIDSILKDIQFRVGGGVVYLDSLDNEHLVHFYTDVCGYRKISERVSDTNNTKYLQYLKFVC
jgi:hypothetical protein